MNAILTGPNSYETAKRKARYGTQSWIMWQDRNGIKKAAPVTYDTMKAAMLDCGTAGHWVLYSSRDRCGQMVYWSWACLMLRNLKAGYYYH